MICGSFWDGALWIQPTEIHTWNGTSFVQALEVFVYDGATWIRFFPCEVVTLLEETLLILDTGQVIKIARDILKGPHLELLELTESMSVAKRFVTAETMFILDSGLVIKINRDTLKGPFAELIELTETGVIFRTRDVSLSETLLLLDSASLTKINRDILKGPFRDSVVLSETGTQVLTFKRFFVSASETMFILDSSSLSKTARDVLKGPFRDSVVLSEAGSVLVDKFITTSETMFILDTESLTKISRDILLTHRDSVVLSETGVIDITVLPPVVSNCVAEEVEADPKARVVFDPGDFCESVRIDKIVDTVHSFHQNMNTAPNTTGITSNYYFGTCPEAVSFDVHPFKADSQSGLEGTVCSSNEVILGTEGCK